MRKINTISRWTVIGPTYRGRAKCRCTCGTVKEVNVANIRNGRSRSCGCFRAEDLSARRTTHGMTESKEYRAWCHMKGRCADENDINFERYGARGITVCAAWVNDFEAFLRDIGPAPYDEASVDRIDVNGDYEPGNCRWADKLTQMNNTTNNVIVEYEGVRQTIAEWARQVGLKYHTLYRRIVVAGEHPPHAFRSV